MDIKLSITDEDRRKAQVLAVKAANDPNNLAVLQKDIINLISLNKMVNVRTANFIPHPSIDCLSQKKFTSIGTELLLIDNTMNPSKPFYKPWEELRTVRVPFSQDGLNVQVWCTFF
jgi:hypothetical protein